MNSSNRPDTTTPARRVAMARVKRATSQLVRWHAEYEDALSDAHDLGVPERALADAGASRIATRSSSQNPGPSRNPGPGGSSRAPDEQLSETGAAEDEPIAGKQQVPELPGLRDRVPADIRDISFPAAVRGYDRRAVDAYVKRVNRVIAELEVGRSPQAAVRNALDRVGAQTSGILQQARESAEEITTSAAAEAEEATGRARIEADEITASARAKAEETTARAQAEADETTGRARTEAEEILARSRSESAERVDAARREIEALREQADTQMRELRADTEAIRQEHGDLVDEIRQLATRLEEIAGAAAARFPHGQPPEGQEPRSEGDDEDEGHSSRSDADSLPPEA
jgi:DivIVA domain-containing protein